jgi:16S rRNA C1402 N4-methylase RsmH
LVDAAVPGVHRPVMSEACVEGLAIRPDGVYVTAPSAAAAIPP